MRVFVQEYEMFVGIDVADTGIGMTEEETAKMFARFYRSPRVAVEKGAVFSGFLTKQSNFIETLGLTRKVESLPGQLSGGQQQRVAIAREFSENKSRNIIAVLAIALTAVLFAALFTTGSGMVENFQRQTMRQADGDGMGVLKYITDGEYQKIKNICWWKKSPITVSSVNPWIMRNY